MKKLENKLNVLAKIAKELNKKKITWAIGASMLLYFKGIVEEFNDIDIMVTEEDIDSLKEVILTFGKLLAPNPNVQYKTKHFLEFVVDGIDIDVMAGFTIVSHGKEYYFPLSQDSINDYTDVLGVKIPLQSIDQWRMYYNLMDRTDRVKLIDNYFSD